MNADKLNYKDAGVDIEAGELMVSLIAPLVKKTRRPEVLGDVEGFAGLFRLEVSKYKKPVLVSGTDGVGTKLKVAQMVGVHNTVGIDLVAMCVNDILVHGAEPLFFLDYIATGKLVPEKIADIVSGIAAGCSLAGCALIGGETAEMPGFYEPDEYDLAGFAVGVVEEDKLIAGRDLKAGDVIIGLASSGLHSNGYSLARKVFFEKAKLAPESYIEELGKTLAEELLIPTRIYVPSVLSLLRELKVKAAAHITGGGIPGNVARVIPQGLTACIDTGMWQVPAVFNLLATLGGVEKREMFRTFNMGIGFVLVVDSSECDKAVEGLKRKGEKAYLIGEMVKGKERVRLF